MKEFVDHITRVYSLRHQNKYYMLR